MYNIYWQKDVSGNPYVSLTFNGNAYEGFWNDLISQANSPFSTQPSEEPDSKPTATAQGSNDAQVVMTVDREELTSQPYGGSRPPTW